MNQKVDGERMKKGYKEKRFAIGVIYHIFTFCLPACDISVSMDGT